MKNERTSVDFGRGAILGLAFAVSAAAAADDALRDLVDDLYGDASYVLVEFPDEPPRLLLLASADVATPRDSDDALNRAVTALASTDPESREDAVLTLGDLGADRRLLAGMLGDPSAEVRDAAAAVLEAMDDEER